MSPDLRRIARVLSRARAEAMKPLRDIRAARAAEIAAVRQALGDHMHLRDAAGNMVETLSPAEAIRLVLVALDAEAAEVTARTAPRTIEIQGCAECPYIDTDPTAWGCRHPDAPDHRDHQEALPLWCPLLTRPSTLRIVAVEDDPRRTP